MASTPHCPPEQPSGFSQIREQMSGPNLHVFILKFLVLKKPGSFTLKKNCKKGIMQLFGADAIAF